MSASADILEFSRKRPEWQQDALRRLAVQGELSAHDIQEYQDALLVECGILPIETKPSFTPLAATHLANTDQRQERVVLKSISEIQNVNQLKPGETLAFGNAGMTLVYGDNGSGKSGYTRIFKKASAARGAEDILADVFDPNYEAKPQASATFQLDLHSGDSKTENTLSWIANGDNHEILRQLRIFDRKAATLYVEKETDLAFVPFNLDLLDNLAAVCTKLKEKIQAKVLNLDSEYRTLQSAIPVKNSEVGVTISRVTSKTTKAELDTLCSWSQANDARLTEARTLLVGAEKTLQEFRLKKGRVEALLAQVSALEKVLADSKGCELKVRWDEATELRKTAEATGKESFSRDNNLLPGVGGVAWRALWDAARNYSVQSAYSGETFPVVTVKNGRAGQCVLCHQELGAIAQQRLVEFEGFVKGNIEKKALAAERCLEDLKANLMATVATQTQSASNTITEIETDDALLSQGLRGLFVSCNARKVSLLGAIETGCFNDLVAPPQTMSEAIRVYIDKLQTRITEMEQALSPEEKSRLQKEIVVLDARKVLAEHRAALNSIVANRLEREKYNACVSELATNTITKAKDKLNEKYISQQFQEILHEELEALGVRRKVTLDMGTHKGASYLKPVFVGSTYRNLDKILSEGEHRAVALACFLAEARMLGTGNPLLIDDPVSSLDHVRRGKVADRLVAAAKERQVIVFTHDMVFWGEVCFKAGELGIPLATNDLRREGTLCGKVGCGEAPWPIMPVSSRLHELESKELPKLKALDEANAPDYRKEARCFGELLRETWERVVEETLFNETVVRYRRSIESTRLRRVSVEYEDWEQIRLGISRTSVWAHDESRGTGGTPPSPDELKKEILTIRKFVEHLTTRHKEVEKERKKRAETPAA